MKFNTRIDLRWENIKIKTVSYKKLKCDVTYSLMQDLNKLYIGAKYICVMCKNCHSKKIYLDSLLNEKLSDWTKFILVRKVHVKSLSLSLYFQEVNSEDIIYHV